MALLVHLVFACGSMAYATVMFFFPSRARMRMTYALVGLTFATGFWLIFATPVHMAEVCVTGLVYVGYVSFALVASRNKLAKIIITK
jgi:hypothetical protein